MNMSPVERDNIDEQAERELAEETAKNIERVKSIKQEMIKIYQENNPRKIDDVEKLLSEWRGREEELLSNIKLKYSAAVTEAQEEQEELISAIDEISKYNAREAALYRLKEGMVSGSQPDLKQVEEDPNKLLISYLTLYVKPDDKITKGRLSKSFLKLLKNVSK